MARPHNKGHSSISKTKHHLLLEATWGMRILVVWNKAAREQLITNNPSQLEKRKLALSPAAIWNFKNAGTISFLEPPNERILPRTGKIIQAPQRLEKATQLLMQSNIGDKSDTLHSQVPFHPKQKKRLLELKAPNWKEWAFTDRR